jgi:hypothetical protein
MLVRRRCEEVTMKPMPLNVDAAVVAIHAREDRLTVAV